jgi:Lon protease-like protein
MWSFAKSAVNRQPHSLPLFPLTTVLFPGGLLPLKIFEQRYVDMAKACLKDGQPFGVCLLLKGDEVAPARADPLEFANVGTQARIVDFDMPQLGILQSPTR